VLDGLSQCGINRKWDDIIRITRAVNGLEGLSQTRRNLSTVGFVLISHTCGSLRNML